MANISPYFGMAGRLTRSKKTVNTGRHPKSYGGNTAENETEVQEPGQERRAGIGGDKPEYKASPSSLIIKSKQNIENRNIKRHITPMYDAEKKMKWEPQDWEQQLKNIYEMRRERNAPVDSMGCDRISDIYAQPNVIKFML